MTNAAPKTVVDFEVYRLTGRQVHPDNYAREMNKFAEEIKTGDAKPPADIMAAVEYAAARAEQAEWPESNQPPEAPCDCLVCRAERNGGVIELTPEEVMKLDKGLQELVDTLEAALGSYTQ